MAKVKADRPETSIEESPTTPAEENATPASEDQAPLPDKSSNTTDPQVLDDLFSALKTLLSTVEKLQKARQDVGDIKPLIIRMLDGELLSGEELEQLKSGVANLSRLVKIYTDYQVALENAQPAREVLDTILKS